jgi:hypothetical protein
MQYALSHPRSFCTYAASSVWTVKEIKLATRKNAAYVYFLRAASRALVPGLRERIVLRREKVGRRGGASSSPVGVWERK